MWDTILNFLRGAGGVGWAAIEMSASAFGQVLYAVAIQPMVRMIATLGTVVLLAASGAIDYVASVLISGAFGTQSDVTVAQIIAWSVTAANNVGLIDALQWFLWLISPVISSGELATLVGIYTFAIPLAFCIHIAMWIVSFGGGAGTR